MDVLPDIQHYVMFNLTKQMYKLYCPTPSMHEDYGAALIRMKREVQ